MTSRQFISADYEATLEVQVRLGDLVGADHPARFVVDLLKLVDFGAFRAHFGLKGGRPYDPVVLCGLLFYGYTRGLFSSRRLERATYEDVGYRYVAGNLHPDHDTLANFRKTFLPEISEVFVQVLVAAHVCGVSLLGPASADGTKVHADAAKSTAGSYGRAGELEVELRAEVAALLAAAAAVDGPEEAARLQGEVQRREERLAQLARARGVLEQRAAERDADEQAAYEAKLAERADRAARTGKPPRGREPQPPTPGPRPKDQYNFTDPDSRIMKESSSGGFEQSYNAQVVTDQASMLITGARVSDHPNDTQELLPDLDAIPAVLGPPPAVASDAGFFSVPNVDGCAARGIDPYIATGREAHRLSLEEVLQGPSAGSPAGAGATPRVQMAAKLQTPAGREIYRLRKCTVEPAIGIIKETMGFRQFSLRGLANVQGEWILVCLAYNIKRLHSLLGGSVPAGVHAAQVAAAFAVSALAWVLALIPMRPQPAVHAPAETAYPGSSVALRLPAACVLELSPTGC
jgi:transposase